MTTLKTLSNDLALAFAALSKDTLKTMSDGREVVSLVANNGFPFVVDDERVDCHIDAIDKFIAPFVADISYNAEAFWKSLEIVRGRTLATPYTTPSEPHFYYSELLTTLASLQLSGDINNAKIFEDVGMNFPELSMSLKALSSSNTAFHLLAQSCFFFALSQGVFSSREQIRIIKIKLGKNGVRVLHQFKGYTHNPLNPLPWGMDV